MKDREQFYDVLEDNYTSNLLNTLRYSKNVENLIKMLKEKRLEKGISIKELSCKTGLAEKDIKSFENYTIMPTLLMFMKIIGALDLKMELKEVK